MIEKLVRDNVKPLSGEVRHKLAPAVHRALMVEKLHEEVEEIRRDPGDPEEYADVLAVLMDLAKLNGVSWDDVIIDEDAKRSVKGGFQKGVFIAPREP